MATTQDIAQAVTVALSTWQADADDKAVAIIVQAVSSRRYTEAELHYAIEQIRVDPEIAKNRNFDNPLTAADFERHVSAYRRLVANLQTKLRLIDVNKLVSEFPHMVSHSDFGVTGATKDNEPLYRYQSSDGPRKDLPFTPLLEETTPDTDREGSTASMGELMTEYTKAA